MSSACSGINRTIGSTYGESYPTIGKYVARSFWGPVRVVQHKGLKMAVKVVNIKRLTCHQKLEFSSFKDDVENEIKIHREICESVGTGRQNIVDFHGLQRDKTNMYIFTEFGTELFSWISDNHEKELTLWRSKLSEGECTETDVSPYELKAKRWIRDIAQGLQFLHSLGICHRDVKAQNLVVVQDKVKLIDFGLAVRFEPWETEFKTTEYVGTPAFLSPEALYVKGAKKAHQVGLFDLETEFWNADKNDTWSFGIAAFTLLFGCAPFEMPCSNDGRFQILTRGKFSNRPVHMNTSQLLRSWNRHHMATQDCIDFFEPIFVHQAQRPTMNEILASPWLQ